MGSERRIKTFTLKRSLVTLSAVLDTPMAVTRPTPPDLPRSAPETPVLSPTEKPDPWVSETSEVEDISERRIKTFTLKRSLVTLSAVLDTPMAVTRPTTPDLPRSAPETPVLSPTEKPD